MCRSTALRKLAVRNGQSRSGARICDRGEELGGEFGLTRAASLSASQQTAGSVEPDR